ncbi:MAG: response regulator [Proteobacteria bacterium]|nr:response regulator [Pseudomonadota bacterium]
MNLFTLASLSVVITCLPLAAFTFFWGTKRIHKFLSLFNLVVGIWCLGQVIVGTATNEEHALLGWKAAHIGGVLVAPVFFYLTCLFCSIKRPKLLFVAYTQAIIYLFLLCATNLIIAKLRYFQGIYFIDATPQYVLAIILYGFFVGLSFFELIRYFSTTHGHKRVQALYNLLGFSFGFSGATLIFLPMFHVDVFIPVGNAGITLYAFVLTYAIFRHHLMDIHLVFRKTLVFSLSAAVVSGLFVILVLFFTRTFSHVVGLDSFATTAIAALVAAFLFAPIQNRIQKTIDASFLGSGYDYTEVVKEASNRLSNPMEAAAIKNFILDTVVMLFDPINTVLLTRRRESFLSTLWRVHPKGGDDTIRTINIPSDSPLIGLIERDKTIFYRDTFIEGPDQEYIALINKILKPIRGEVLAPIFIDGMLSSILIVGEKASGRIYTKQDLDILHTLVNQASIALENADLYEGLEARVIERTKELDKVNENLKKEIAERKKAEEKALRATAAKSEFLANMSHEIRTPMNAIIGFTDMLIDTKVNAVQLDYIRTIKNSGEALLSLLNDILDFSKVEAGELSFEEIDFDPELLAYDVSDLIRPRVDYKPIELLCHIADDLPALVKGDPARFRQVITNLMGNAVKFTSAGEIELSLAVDQEEEGRIRIHTTIRDTGIGIPDDKVQTIFNPFQQADGSMTRRFGGTGLGLTICKKISSLMGGDVWVESKKDQGSIFHFTAWLKKSEQKESRRWNTKLLKSRNILVVDDNQANLRILTHMLEAGGMTVLSLDKGRDVVPALLAEQESGNFFDLCIFDVQMPEITGHEVAEEIKKNTDAYLQGLPLVALSSLMDAKKCEESGFMGYLSKPVRKEKLFQMIGRILGSAEEKRDQVTLEDENIFTQYSVLEDLKHGMQILLVEDNLVNQKLALLMLQKAGYKVEIANNGKEAVDRFLATPEDYDLILMDIQMPVMDGLEASRIIRASGSEIPIVAMTAHAMTGDREKCLEAGMNDYMTKPIKRDIVFATLGKWVFPKDTHHADQ